MFLTHTVVLPESILRRQRARRGLCRPLPAPEYGTQGEQYAETEAEARARLGRAQQ